MIKDFRPCRVNVLAFSPFSYQIHFVNQIFMTNFAIDIKHLGKSIKQFITFYILSNMTFLIVFMADIVSKLMHLKNSFDLYHYIYAMKSERDT